MCLFINKAFIFWSEYMKDEDLRMIGTSDGEEMAFSSTIWEDEEEQRFYEYLTDMKEFLPSITVRPPEPVSEVMRSQILFVVFSF
jgi:hypothetical protein